jgi:hypothetical protein
MNIVVFPIPGDCLWAASVFLSDRHSPAERTIRTLNQARYATESRRSKLRVSRAAPSSLDHQNQL